MRRLALLPELTETKEFDSAIHQGLVALHQAVDQYGAMPVSYATPIGSRDVYVTAPTGVFPWGQGPLILALLEEARA